jgi:membrane protease YdiL (CAAX protease family)
MMGGRRPYGSVVTWLMLSGLSIGLTFSYAILEVVLPQVVAGRPLAKMSLWTTAILSSYVVYSWLTSHEVVPHPVRWSLNTEWSVVAPAVVGILVVLAVLFPSPRHTRSDMLYIVAVAVIGEELLFRGLLWDLVDGWTGDRCLLGLPVTMWLTALAFGVMHLQYHHFHLHQASIVQATYSFPVGMALGAIRERTGSVVSSALAHSTLNSLLNLVLAALR